MTEGTRKLLVTSIVAMMLCGTTERVKSQEIVSPEPLPASKLPEQQESESDRPVVRIGLAVLEANVDRKKKVGTTIKKLFPQIKSGEASMFNLGKLAKDQESTLIRSLVENGLAKNLSRPQIMTLSGKEAMIQIGQQISFPSKDDPRVKENRDIGLTIQCTPVVDHQADEIVLNLDVAHSTIDESRSMDTAHGKIPGISELTVSTKVKVKNGETIVLQGPGINGSLLLLVTPATVPAQSTAAANSSAAEQPRSTPKIDQSSDKASKEIISALGNPSRQ